MATRSVQARRAAPADEVFVQIRLRSGARIGPGKAELLKHIVACGSISAAGRRMSVSYKRAWDLVKELNTTFCEPVFATKVGGAPTEGARLTPFGIAMLGRYQAFQGRARDEADEFIVWLNDQTSPLAPKTEG